MTPPREAPDQDIVERLREQYAEQFKEEQPAEVIYRYQQERLEAADEITRLRSERQDISRLREALIEECAKFIESEAARIHREGYYGSPSSALYDAATALRGLLGVLGSVLALTLQIEGRTQEKTT